MALVGFYEKGLSIKSTKFRGYKQRSLACANQARWAVVCSHGLRATAEKIDTLADRLNDLKAVSIWV